MFRRVYDAVARRLLSRPYRSRPTGEHTDPTREDRAPGPHVWRLPDPRDARWRRWAKRNRSAGHRLPFPRDEECWRAPVPARPRAPLWEAEDDVVRPYVLNARHSGARGTDRVEIEIPVPVDFP